MTYKVNPKLAATLTRLKAAKEASKEVSKKEGIVSKDAFANIKVHKKPSTPAKPSISKPSNIAMNSKLEEIKARLAAAKKNSGTSKELKPSTLSAAINNALPAAKKLTYIDKYGNVIEYNEQQEKFVKLMAEGKSCVLIGAAGSGKTTCTQGSIQELIKSGKVPTLLSDGHKHLTSGTPGILIISFTRRAVNNIKRVQPEDMKANCITAHKLLEYQPVYYEVWDEENKVHKKTMRFEPARGHNNPLPASIHTIVVEEASMLSIEMANLLQDAIGHKVQWVFIGDIQQLPPVFGPAILGFAMLSLPVVELTHIYRQALQSPIIRLAHRILSGKPIPKSEFSTLSEETEHGNLTIHAWKKKLSADNALTMLSGWKPKSNFKGFFIAAIDAKKYNPYEDVILMPYNKACGTIELNKNIANYLAKTANKETFEVIAGFNKKYYSIGDRVMFEKEDAVIIDIQENPSYSGARYQPSSVYLDYWGFNSNAANEARTKKTKSILNEDIDFLLEAAASSEDRVTQASHIITIQFLEEGLSNLELSKAAEINALDHSYAMTVHKAQGSEWRKVFLVLHQSHATMLQRELLYTAVTRAREELYIICEPDSLEKGIKSQKVKGNTLTEKAEYFKGKKSDTEVRVKFN